MPRYNVEVNGKWACFSTVYEAFITPLMPLEDYERWRDAEYCRQEEQLERANRMTLAEALYELSLNHTDEEILKNMRETGLIAG